MRQLLLVGLVVISLAAGAAPAAGQESVTLTVSVVTGSGDPVGGATINATWDGGGKTATTASNGKAFVDVPRGADVRLAVESENHIRNTPKLVRDASEQEVTVEVAPKGQFTVQVLDEDGPVANARIDLKRDGTTILNGRTDEDGRLSSGAIEQGEYVLDAFRQGYHRNLTRITVGENTEMELQMRRGTVDVRFEVVDDHFDPPRTLTTAQVVVEGVGSQRTGAGTVTFTLPVNTQYHVTATKSDYVANDTRFFVGTNEVSKTLAIQREPSLAVEASNQRVVVGEQLSVTVTNAYGEPVPGASVTLDGEQVATTGENGMARLQINSEGQHLVAAEQGDVQSEEVTVEGVADVDATPTESPTVTGTPESGPQVPLPGFTPATAVLALLALVGVSLLGRRR